jgi:hypothetical protein
MGARYGKGGSKLMIVFLTILFILAVVLCVVGILVCVVGILVCVSEVSDDNYDSAFFLLLAVIFIGVYGAGIGLALHALGGLN